MRTVEATVVLFKGQVDCFPLLIFFPLQTECIATGLKPQSFALISIHVCSLIFPLFSYISVLDVVCFMWAVVGETQLVLVENEIIKELLMMGCVSFLQHELLHPIFCAAFFFGVKKVLYCDFT